MARVWITDGSVPVFSDTQRLRASHRGLFGLPVRYEGFVDGDVPRGTATVVGDRADDQLFVEAEWCLEFEGGIDRYLRDPALADGSAAIVLQGMIEGKWLNRLLGTRAWRPASLGNNLLAEGPGIRTTLGALDDGVEGTIGVEYGLAGGGVRRQRASAAALRGENVPALVRDVLRVCRNEGLDAIDLGAVGEEAAVVNERQRARASLRADRLPLPDPRNLRPHRAKDRLVGAVLREGIAVPPGSPIAIETTDGDGRVVGRGTLVWERGPRPASA